MSAEFLNLLWYKRNNQNDPPNEFNLSQFCVSKLSLENLNSNRLIQLFLQLFFQNLVLCLPRKVLWSEVKTKKLCQKDFLFLFCASKSEKVSLIFELSTFPTCFALQMYAMTWHTNLISRLGDMDVFILLISCICHDLDHPGYNNVYQINAKTELALR